MKPSILYVSETVPGNTIASSVLIYRHLTWLEARGYSITVFPYGDKWKSQNLPGTWKVLSTTIRKWWYLPYRPDSILRWVRYRMLLSDYRKAILETKPTAIFTHLNGQYYSGFAAFLSEQLGIPLYVFYHDNTEKMNYTSNPAMYELQVAFNKRIVGQASAIWSISDQLVYPGTEIKTHRVFPVPELISRKAVWKPTFSTSPVVGFAGSLYDQIVPATIRFVKVLEKLNGKLIIFSPVARNVQLLQEASQAVVVMPVNTTRFVCEYMIDHCSSFLVNYPETVAGMPWIDSNFPSKFPQFLQTGLPVLCQVPADSAIGIWCKNSGYTAYTDRFDEDGTAELIRQTTDETRWNLLAQESIRFSETEFNPETINQVLIGDLERKNRSGN
ncbi:MAG: hypothetical protein HUU10_09380 [Bacteroidetes bacterium]|nr:hypothetical protein [Bacteroidota bacterium]